MNVRQQMLAVFVALCFLVTSQSAWSANPTPPWNELAQAIEGSLPLLNTKAFPSNDWCFQVETDPHENWWEFRYGGKNNYHQSLYSSRIKLIYQTNSQNVVMGFASIFLAIDLNKSPTYTAEALIGSGGRPTLPPNILFPTTNTHCASLKDFLRNVFSEYLPSWKPTGNPLCDDAGGTCAGVQVTDSDGHTYTILERQTSLSPCDPDPQATSLPCKGDTNVVYWNFNGKDHKILGAIRFLITLSDTSGVPVYGYLTVGYGGNSGAG